MQLFCSFAIKFINMKYLVFFSLFFIASCGIYEERWEGVTLNDQSSDQLSKIDLHK